jgi:hypothetical protein
MVDLAVRLHVGWLGFERPQPLTSRTTSRKARRMPKIFVFLSQGEDGFIWNIDSNVGLNSPNKRIDVELVQFGYFAKSFNVANQSPELRRLCAAVTPGAPYSGAANDPLTVAIVAHQKERGGTQDGHVSPIHGRTDVYVAKDGPHSFMLAGLVNNMRDLLKADFPRIDKHIKCPAELRKSVFRCFGV